MPDNKGLLTEFKEFVLRGNVVDLAVAIVVGVAFGAVVKALVGDLITPIISIPGHSNFQDLHFTIRRSVFAYGDFINNVITFVSIAVAVFFFVVKPVDYLLERRRRGQVEPDGDDRPCPECLSTIPKAATRCAFCTAQVGSAA
jgi:large conductance mechanosensitive channel